MNQKPEFRKEPSMVKKEPSMVKKEPSMVKKEPSMVKKEPSMVKKEPSFHGGENKKAHLYDVETNLKYYEIEGNYGYMDKDVNISFEYFIMKQGLMIAKGKDRFGDFKMAGSYENDGSIHFSKQTIGVAAFSFKGNIKKMSERNEFTISGKWTDSDGDSNDFRFVGKIK